MSAGWGEFAAGLLGGIAQAHEHKKERELQEEYKKLQMDLLKQQAKTQQTQLEIAQRELAIKENDPKRSILKWALGQLNGGGQGGMPQEGDQPLQQPTKTFMDSKLPAPGSPLLGDMADYWAKYNGLDPNIFRRVIAQESGWNPQAMNVNKNGTRDYGLGQINDTNLQKLGLTNPMDPNENLKAASTILAQNLQQFGDYPRAVAAYNVGPKAVAEKGPHGPTYNAVFGKQDLPQPLPQQIAQAQMQQQMGGGGLLNWLTPDVMAQGVLEEVLGVKRPEAEYRMQGDDLLVMDKYGKVRQILPGRAKTEKVTMVNEDGSTWEGYREVPQAPRPGWQTPFVVGGSAPSTSFTPQTAIPQINDSGKRPEAPPPGITGAVKTAPAKGASPADAAKIELAQSGLNAFDELKGLVFDNNGTPNYWNLFNSMVGTPKSEGRNISSLMFKSVDAIVRAATGAGMPDAEMNRYLKAYTPSVGDNDATIRSKMAGLEEFLSGYLQKMDPTGATRARSAPPSEIRKPVPKQEGKPNKLTYNPKTGQLE